MLKKLFVIMCLLLVTCIALPVTAEIAPISITEPSAIPFVTEINTTINVTPLLPVIDINATLPNATLPNETLPNATLPNATPTPVPTLESMANARELSNGMMFPNYKVVPVPTDKGDGLGALYIQLMCHHNLISKDFTVQVVKNPKGIQFTNGKVVPKEFADLFEKVGNATLLELDHTGGWDKRVLPNIYVVTLLDGNGGQPETAVVQVFENYRSDVIFIGHAVSMSNVQEAPSQPSCPIATGGSWNKWHPFRASFTLEPTSPPMWVQVETTVNGQECTKWKWFKCQNWKPVTKVQTQWHLSQWSNHFNLIMDDFPIHGMPVSVSVKTVGCKPVTPCERPEHTDTTDKIQ